jgi:UDPglucose 6-dehydrogenase
MKICIIGTGYVGLVSGTCFADLGNTVTCVDTNLNKITKLKNGIVPFYEPGLKEKIEKNVSNKRLSFSSTLTKPILESQFIFIAVGTPSTDEGKADLTFIFSAVESIIKILKTVPLSSDKKIIVTKSTVPVGTGIKISTLFSKNGIPKTKIGILSNPEFLREGSALYDFFNPDRVVIGGENEEDIDKLHELYKPIRLSGLPVVKTDIQSSELSKYASNAFLATKISFTNEISNLCEAIDANVHDVTRIMGLDNRIGKHFLRPGPGYGGSCFPKDVNAFINIGNENNSSTLIAQSVNKVNQTQKTRHIGSLKEYYKNNLKGKTITILGISFKPNTDDIREAPSIEIIKLLLSEGCSIKVFDPEALDNLKNDLNLNVTYCKNSYEAAKNSDAIIIVTEWNTFRELDLKKIHGLMNHPLLMDLRSIYSEKNLVENGFNYFIIGKAKISHSTLQVI